ncbi:hypothetical protein PTTG_25725 [Puccinia triticina 1-1 BBBD Race 1]|uniref:Hydrophobin n=2 Tax=Puccinia triticina TaxID=208348 RepID=A0A180H0K2_PUCT1|nr:uncharacterized protein PtA15_8A399 [Puccinia triticina]OAV98271.1 hypothetical protein PTTG_25725 [Puccinia triticina 1-1 BBBD Race 1]WAQ87495.1 hypothetical protein PtA15_8A399 [Puccinia triticina]
MVATKLIRPFFMSIALGSQAVHGESRPGTCPDPDHGQGVCALLTYDNNQLVKFEVQIGQDLGGSFSCANVATNIINMCCRNNLKLGTAARTQLVPIDVANYGGTCFNAPTS